MTQPAVLDATRTALLLMDFQQDILAGNVPAEQVHDMLDRAAGLLEAARRRHMAVIHVMVAFRPGHPEVSADNRVFSRIREDGRLVEGAEGTAIHPRLQPAADEPVVRKHRVGAFSETELETLLRARRIDTLLLAGVATSGVVLSTVRHAFDRDYRLLVVGDCCADGDAEVHQVLLGKVIARHADVVSAAEAVAALDAS